MQTCSHVISLSNKLNRSSVISKASAAAATQGHDYWLTDKEPPEHKCQSPGHPIVLLEIPEPNNMIGWTKGTDHSTSAQ